MINVYLVVCYSAFCWTITYINKVQGHFVEKQIEVIKANKAVRRLNTGLNNKG